MRSLFDACSTCNSESDQQSSSVVTCISLTIQLVFFIVMIILCLKQFWIRRQNNHRLFTKKCFILHAILILSLCKKQNILNRNTTILRGINGLITYFKQNWVQYVVLQLANLTVFFALKVQILQIIALPSHILKMSDLFARQILFCSIIFYFIRKYYKMTDSLTPNIQTKIASVYGAVVFVQVALMIASYFEDYQKTCSDLTGIWIRIVGSIIGFAFVSVGFLYYKKFTISKKNFISLFTIEQEQGIKNFIDQEDKLEDLLSLIVVYVMSQFLNLCVLIYYEIQINSNSSTNCSLLPPTYLNEKGDSGVAGEETLKYVIEAFVMFLPQVYLYNLFKYKKPRTDYSNDMKKSLIENEELPNGFGRNIQFNNKKYAGSSNTKAANRNLDQSANGMSNTTSFISAIDS